MARRVKLMDKDETERAKAWGQAHGYYWQAGGYVYKEGETRLNREGLPRAVCQGWYRLYQINARVINRWCEEQDAKGDK